MRAAAVEDAARTAPRLLVTERLWLREALPEEARQIAAGDDAGLRWVGDSPSEETQVAARMTARAADAGVHRPGWGMYLLVRSADARVVGAMGFHGPPSDGSVEIGFDLAAPARGQGHATEALRELARWALEQPEVDTVIATTTEDNTPSQRVMERAGFQLLPRRDAEGLLVHRLTR
ncbi:GNAT family N-acetyltransferase [Streptomyces sp. NPDC093586]|uniref:GNAT family N-acetyltransferase n=1 Tax=Streptomyces sp. NPDC093586 TaxID=3366042 RepID=UPI003816E302